MGDVTQIIVNVDGGAPHVRKHISDLAAEYLYSPWGADAYENALDEWLEGSCGAGDELYGKVRAYLRNVPPANRPNGISITEDGKYEWNGTTYRWRPRIGWHSADINTDGSISVDAKTLLSIVRKSRTIEQARKRVDRIVGVAWDGAGLTPSA